MIAVGEPLPRIERAEALDGRKVRIGWRSGETRVVDLAPVIASRRIFRPLRDDDELFRSLRVAEYGNAIEWASDLDLSALWLDRLPSAEFDNRDFRAAMAALDMTLDGMAAALGLSRRLIADYRKTRPIPRHVALATRYLLDHKGA
ncbi:DUF2442 domain-containing protein [Zavarzinia aquatilis]|nr:DUF2442 domain-containing protein [Zavarzinia aquatilis]